MAAAERWRVRPWLLVSAAWIIPAILGAVDAIAQHYLETAARCRSAGQSHE